MEKKEKCSKVDEQLIKILKCLGSLLFENILVSPVKYVLFSLFLNCGIFVSENTKSNIRHSMT